MGALAAISPTAFGTEIVVYAEADADIECDHVPAARDRCRVARRLSYRKQRERDGARPVRRRAIVAVAPSKKLINATAERGDSDARLRLLELQLASSRMAEQKAARRALERCLRSKASYEREEAREFLEHFGATGRRRYV